ncbi:DUF5343 domain-containing protein [Trichlorobacter lovleyi]|uniref:DUF5343 domain-containing protein n=1 Tax=Trichlorobacter lovleyi TaxID=313985 RepID=UPI0024806B5F|nr:DUF5343 domain-containing protein [Trichlorobacter lovleyi]
MSVSFPYVAAPGNIKRVLTKIQEAATPSRFTQDFLETKLGLSGGGARALIPLLKRIGFLASDGAPTDLYKRFRNPTQSGVAAAEALKTGYKSLFEANEYAHELSDPKLKGLFVQLTGEPESSRVLTLIISAFKALKEFGNFEEQLHQESETVESIQQESIKQITLPEEVHSHRRSSSGVGLNLSYTINLNLPATSDIAVFDAIFKSLKANLLKE